MRLYLIVHREKVDIANEIAEKELNGGKENFSVPISKKDEDKISYYGASLWISDNLENKEEIIEKISNYINKLGGFIYMHGQEVIHPDKDGKNGLWIKSFKDVLKINSLKELKEVDK